MTKTYIDKVTHKPIKYNEEDVFVIYSKGGYHKKRLERIYSADRIEEAFNFFYMMQVPMTQRKHLCVHSKDKMLPHEGKVILNMKGYFPTNVGVGFSHGRARTNYRHSPTLNLIKTPETIAIKLRMVDFTTFPYIHEKWTKTKLMYCLLSYFFSLNQEEKTTLLEKAFRLYASEKLASGGNIEESTELKRQAMEDLDDL
jgi:hypothetical protein